MAVARVLETNGGTVSEAAKTSNLNRTRVSQARTVLQYAPDLADNVLAGAASLDEAYGMAQARSRPAGRSNFLR